MKAAIDKNGTLKLSPENETEAFALRCWNEKAFIPMTLDKYAEVAVLRSSMVLVDFNVPEAAQGGAQ